MPYVIHEPGTQAMLRKNPEPALAEKRKAKGNTSLTHSPACQPCQLPFKALQRRGPRLGQLIRAYSLGKGMGRSLGKERETAGQKEPCPGTFYDLFLGFFGGSHPCVPITPCLPYFQDISPSLVPSLLIVYYPKWLKYFVHDKLSMFADGSTECVPKSKLVSHLSLHRLPSAVGMWRKRESDIKDRPLNWEYGEFCLCPRLATCLSCVDFGTLICKTRGLD